VFPPSEDGQLQDAPYRTARNIIRSANKTRIAALAGLEKKVKSIGMLEVNHSIDLLVPSRCVQRTFSKKFFSS
jgi:hypothetical protein